MSEKNTIDLSQRWPTDTGWTAYSYQQTIYNHEVVVSIYCAYFRCNIIIVKLYIIKKM